MKTYTVKRTPEGVKLFVKDGAAAASEITPAKSLAILRHSPDGFEFGFLGSGPSQLALAILLDAFADTAPAPNLLALDHYVSFKMGFLGSAVRGLEQFTITQREILRWLANRTLAGVRA